MIFKNFTKFIKYYGKGRKAKLFGFFLLSLVVGFLEFLGIALVYPFILLILKPNVIVNSVYYNICTKAMHTHNSLVIAFILGIFTIFLFIVKNLFMIGSLYLQNKFTNNWKLDIGKQLMHYYLYSSYKNVLQISPAEKLYNLNHPINQSIDIFIFRLINLVTNIVIVLMILFILVIKFLLAAVVTGVFVIVTMLVQTKTFKKRMSELSQVLVRTSSLANEKLTENVYNLKEIKILSAEDYFYNEYVKTQKDLNQAMFKNNFYGAIPTYIIEILVVLALFILVGIISIQNLANTSWMVASYAVLAAAIFRVAPALNRIQASLNWINTSRDFVKIMNIEYEKIDFNSIEKKSDFKIKFENCLNLIDISFSYKKNKPVIKDMNLEIKKGEFVGIIGLSGAGKTTLADIIMGLLPVDSGKIFVDDFELNKDNFIVLRKLIGYVPQQVNILDGSVKRNIAWGIEEKFINEEKVVDVLKKAQIYDFVKELDGGINSKIIVNSTGLSQGQKQRLAIARALYKESEILIFDEATSSLDVETEYEITKLLNNLKGEKTIIAIAHRLSTLKSCDRLIYIKNGKIIDTGSFKELARKHSDFEKLIKLSSLNQ